MRTLLSAACALLVIAPAVHAVQIDYASLWEKAAPFHLFLENVKARQDQWKPRFAEAAIEPAALEAARTLAARRRLLAVADDRCSDSAWALPYVAKLAAAVPEKLELRVISRADGSRIQSAHLTPDGRLATPIIIVLDENNRYIGGWVERPSELQTWYLENKPTVTQAALYEHVNKWYTKDAGQSTVRELLLMLGREAADREAADREAADREAAEGVDRDAVERE